MARPPAYDRAEVLEQATRLFWEQGYGQTSVNDLVEVTGLKPGSLYAAFGSKKGIFLEVLEHYNSDLLKKIRSLGEEPVIDAVHGLLQQIVQDTLSGSDRRGCLSVNTMLEMSQHDEEIRAQLERHNRYIRKSFTDLMLKAQRNGEIHSDRNPESLASFLVNNIWGMRVACRGTPDKRVLNAIVDNVMAHMRA